MILFSSLGMKIKSSLNKCTELRNMYIKVNNKAKNENYKITNKLRDDFILLPREQNKIISE